MQVDPRVLTHINTKECSYGDGKTPPAGNGSAISTCPAPAVHGAWGRVGEGRGVPVPWPLALAGQQRHPSRAEPAQQGARDVGTGRAGVTTGECAPTSKRQVIQGDRAVRPIVQKQNVGFGPGRLSQAQGVPHPHGVSNGKEACALAGAEPAVGLPTH